MPCEEYGRLKYMRDIEMSTAARFSNARGDVSDSKAEQLAKKARHRADAFSKEMQEHRGVCKKCRAGNSPLL